MPSRQPEICGIDWSAHSSRRWLTTALPEGNRAYWRLLAPRPVEHLSEALSSRVETQSAPHSLLMGVDTPIGVPAAWAHAVGAPSFRELLRLVATEPSWSRVLSPSDEPSLLQPFYPASPGTKGQHSRQRLLDALRLSSPEALLRRCDVLAGAFPLFFCVGARQVGKGAIAFWSEVLMTCEGAALWPFDGELLSLLETSAVVLAEVYPGLATRRFGLPLGRRGYSKRDPQVRRQVAEMLLQRPELRALIRVSNDLAAMIAEGFPSDDAFDSFLAAVLMVEDVARRAAALEPALSQQERAVEGWIFGLEAGG